VYDARGLLPPQAVFRRNAAVHIGFEVPRPISQLPFSELKRFQRGNRTASNHSDTRPAEEKFTEPLSSSRQADVVAEDEAIKHNIEANNCLPSQNTPPMEKLQGNCDLEDKESNLVVPHFFIGDGEDKNNAENAMQDALDCPMKNQLAEKDEVEAMDPSLVNVSLAAGGCLPVGGLPCAGGPSELCLSSELASVLTEADAKLISTINAEISAGFDGAFRKAFAG